MTEDVQSLCQLAIVLAGERVTLTEHDRSSRETVRRRLAENELWPWRKDMCCIVQVDGMFVARMESDRLNSSWSSI
jgi:hypothetical protein